MEIGKDESEKGQLRKGNKPNKDNYEQKNQNNDNSEKDKSGNDDSRKKTSDEGQL